VVVFGLIRRGALKVAAERQRVLGPDKDVDRLPAAQLDLVPAGRVVPALDGASQAVEAALFIERPEHHLLAGGEQAGREGRRVEGGVQRRDGRVDLAQHVSRERAVVSVHGKGRWGVGLYTILPLPLLYGIHCDKGGLGGNNILRNDVGDKGWKWGAQP